MIDNISLRLIPFFLITLLAVGGVEGFYRYADNYISSHKTLFFPTSGSVTEKKKISPQNMGKATKMNYDIIVARALFKGPEKETNENASSVKSETKETLSSINFALIGTITGKEDGTRAILLDNKKKTQEIFHQGDGFENVIVKKISRGKVTLDVDGSSEVLLIEESKRKQSPLRRRPTPGVPLQVRSQPNLNKAAGRTPRRIIELNQPVAPPPTDSMQRPESEFETLPTEITTDELIDGAIINE